MTIEEKVTEVINDYVSSNGTASKMTPDQLYSLVNSDEDDGQEKGLICCNLLVIKELHYITIKTAKIVELLESPCFLSENNLL